MSDYNYAALKKKVAQKLRLIADNEGLPPEYASIIAEALIQVQDQLDELGIVTFDVENDGIEYRYADPFIDLVAAQCVNEFDVPEPYASQIRSNLLGLPARSIAERRLRAFFAPTKPQTTTDVTVV